MKRNSRADECSPHVVLISMRPQLPQETLEEIISHLGDDEPALLSCSLANSALVPASRRLLFADVTLFPHEIKAAIHLLAAACGTIAEAIRSLKYPTRSRSATCATRAPLISAHKLNRRLMFRRCEGDFVC